MKDAADESEACELIIGSAILTIEWGPSDQLHHSKQLLILVFLFFFLFPVDQISNAFIPKSMNCFAFA